MQRIFIGDVQGCADELDALLERADATFGRNFELWVAGDLVNRGPDNRRCLARVRTLVDAGRAEYVLGNHEISLLAVHFGLRPLGPNDTIGDVLEAADVEDWVDWLRRRPLVVPGRIAGQPFAMLHASASPSWSFDHLIDRGAEVASRLSGSSEAARAFLALDPETDDLRDTLGRLTRCRSVSPDGAWSSLEPEAPMEPWHAAWSRAGHDYGIVYGHWARQGLHLAPGLRGLDTGCVHHGRGRDGFLTAWLPEEGAPDAARRAFDLPDDRLWQIPARRRYYDPVPTGA